MAGSIVFGTSRSRTRLPRATYRLQFHEGFPFEAAIALLPYLQTMGVSHVYTSPIATARAGSAHGYDIVDHRINPALGGEDGFRKLAERIRDVGMGTIIDVVPNTWQLVVEII